MVALLTERPGGPRSAGPAPDARDAFASGRLSYSKVRALTRVAGPDTEAALLELAAEATAAQVERVVREWRRSDAVDEDTVRAKRRFEHWWDDDGMLHVRMCLDAEEGRPSSPASTPSPSGPPGGSAPRRGGRPLPGPRRSRAARHPTGRTARRTRWRRPGSGRRSAGVQRSPRWPPPHPRSTAGPATRRAGRSSSTPTRR